MKRNKTNKPNEKRDVRLQEEIDDSRNRRTHPSANTARRKSRSADGTAERKKVTKEIAAARTAMS